MPGPTPVAQYNAKTSSPTTGAISTSTFTPVNGEWLVVKAETWANNITMSTPTGGGLTYTPLVNYGPAGFRPWVGIWAAQVTGSPTNMSVSSTPSANAQCSIEVERWSNATVASPVTATANAASGAANGSLTTTRANSAISWVASDAQSVDPATRAYLNSATEENVRNGTSGANGVGYFAYQAVATAGATSFGLSAPTGMQYAIAGVEVKAGMRIRPTWTPPNTDNGNNEHNLGHDIKADVGITANGLWWWHDGVTPPSTVRAQLWLTSGPTLVADSGTVSTTGFTTAAWNYIPFASIFACAANTTYSISVYSTGTYKYSSTDLSADILDASGHVRALAHTGRFLNAAGAGFPTSTWDGMFGVDLDFSFSSGISVTLGIPSETDSAQSTTRRKSRTLGIPSETDTLFSIKAVKTRTLGQPSETNVAQSVTRLKSRTMGIPVTTATALGTWGHRKTANLGLPVEFDLPLSLVLSNVIVAPPDLVVRTVLHVTTVITAPQVLTIRTGL